MRKGTAGHSEKHSGYTGIHLWGEQSIWTLQQWPGEALLCTASWCVTHAVWGGWYCVRAYNCVLCGKVRRQPWTAVLASPLFEAGSLSCLPLCVCQVHWLMNFLESLLSLPRSSPSKSWDCMQLLLQGFWRPKQRSSDLRSKHLISEPRPYACSTDKNSEN